MLEVLIADDHPLFREALADVVARIDPDHRCLEACSLDEAVALALDHPALDMILLDLRMPGMDGLDGLVRLRREVPAIPVVMVSAATERATVLQALGHGAAGFVTKSSPRPEIVEALRQVLSGAVYVPAGVIRETAPAAPDGAPGLAPDALAALTPKQMQVLERLARGESNKQIGLALGLAEPTVKAHVSALFRKLNVRSRGQAIVAASSVDFSRKSR